jgi:hypothetical protein
LTGSLPEKAANFFAAFSFFAKTLARPSKQQYDVCAVLDKRVMLSPAAVLNGKQLFIIQVEIRGILPSVYHVIKSVND